MLLIIDCAGRTTLPSVPLLRKIHHQTTNSVETFHLLQNRFWAANMTFFGKITTVP